MLTHFSLFSGIGGIDLSAEWAGFESVGQCEFADYPTKVLEKHWPEVPKWRDVRNVTAESVQERGITNITVLSGGFPCQPFSGLGSKRGKDDDRYLWPEMLRVINELRPTWVIGENVANFVNMALDDALSDMEGINYSCRSFVIPAAGIGATDERYRVFIVAHLHGIPSIKTNKKSISKQVEWNPWLGPAGQIRATPSQFNWQKSEPPICGMDDGISFGMDRLKCLGNAVNPYQVYPFFKAIADIESEVNSICQNQHPVNPVLLSDAQSQSMSKSQQKQNHTACQQVSMFASLP